MEPGTRWCPTPLPPPEVGGWRQSLVSGSGERAHDLGGSGVAATAGAVGRFGVMAGLERRFDREIPWGTAIVNLGAAFLLGWLVGSDPAQDAASLAGAGFLGSFSTFSTWMVEAVFIAGAGTPGRLTRAAGRWSACLHRA